VVQHSSGFGFVKYIQFWFSGNMLFINGLEFFNLPFQGEYTKTSVFFMGRCPMLK